jgi:hypothetical protein
MPSRSDDRCAYPRCKADSDMIYLGKPLCDFHWVQGSEDVRSDALRKKLGLPLMVRNVVVRDTIRVVKVLLFGFKRKKLRLMAKELGLAWNKNWDRKEAKSAVKAAMLRM